MPTIDKPLPPVPAAASASKIADMTEEELAKSIKEKISLMLGSFRSSVERAMEVGDLLNEAKSRVGHGNFEAWLRNCLPEFRVSSAYILGDVLNIRESQRTNRETKRLAEVMRTLGWKLAEHTIKVGKKPCRAYYKPQPQDQQ